MHRIQEALMISSKIYHGTSRLANLPAGITSGGRMRLLSAAKQAFPIETAPTCRNKSEEQSVQACRKNDFKAQTLVEHSSNQKEPSCNDLQADFQSASSKVAYIRANSCIGHRSKSQMELGDADVYQMTVHGLQIKPNSQIRGAV